MLLKHGYQRNVGNMELKYGKWTDSIHLLKYVHVAVKKKSDLKLSDRVYTCDCGNVMDRDLNASINLFTSKKIYNTNVNRLYICTVGYIGIYACGVSQQTVVARVISEAGHVEAGIL